MFEPNGNFNSMLYSSSSSASKSPPRSSSCGKPLNPPPPLPVSLANKPEMCSQAVKPPINSMSLTKAKASTRRAGRMLGNWSAPRLPSTSLLYAMPFQRVSLLMVDCLEAHLIQSRLPRLVELCKRIREGLSRDFKELTRRGRARRHAIR
jgi:hypothetical protein